MGEVEDSAVRGNQEHQAPISFDARRLRDLELTPVSAFDVPVTEDVPFHQRILVAGVGYTMLRDLSAGPVLVEQLQRRQWPDGVVVTDLSHGPIDVLFQLQSMPLFSLGVFVTAVSRDREPGSVSIEPWSPPPLSLEQLQERVSEAVTGIINLDNLLLILNHFQALPERVIVIEIEPQEEDWGIGFSDRGEAALAEATRSIGELVAQALDGGEHGYPG